MQQRGFVGTTIEDVAQQLELTKAAFYYYVQNKEELLFQILSQTLNVTVERIALIERSSASPHEKLRAIIDAFVHLMADRPDFFTVYFQEKGHLDPGHLRTITRTEATIVHTIERVYREGVTKGTFQKIDPTVAAFGILGLCFWVHKWFRPQGRLGIEEVSRAFQSLAADGYLVRPKPRATTA